MATFVTSVIVLIAILWSLGWYAKRWVQTDSDFLLAGRQVTLIPGIASICGIAFAGSMTSIVPGLTIQYGFMGWILGGSLPLVIGYTLYGLYAGPYIRRSGAYTIPEWLEMRFDVRTRVVVSAATLLGVAGVVAMNVVAMALIMQGFLGAPLWVMISVVLVGHLTFILLGGMWALTLTDVVQVLLGFILLPGLALYCITTYGGWDLISQDFVTETPLSTGLLGTFPIVGLSYPSVLTVSLVVGFFIQWGGNYYWLRAAAAQTESIARSQFIIGGILVLVIHGAIGILGLYAGSIYRDSFLDPTNPVNPMAAYGLLMRDFPAGIALLGLVAALAATISTTSNAHMGITSSLARDVYQRFVRPNASSAEVLRASRILTVLTGAAIWLLSFYPGGPYYLLAVSCAMLGPAAFIFFIGHRWEFITSAGAFWGTLAGILAMLVYEALNLAGVDLGSTHTVIIGSTVTLPIVFGVSLVTRPQPTPDLDSERTPARLCREQEQILVLIQNGYTTMVELSDYTGLTASGCYQHIQGLIRAGLVQRLGNAGLASFTFEPAAGAGAYSESGSAITALTKTMALTGTKSDGTSVLKGLEDSPKSLPELSSVTDLPPSRLSVIVNRLDRLGYIRTAGIWQRTIRLSSTGREQIKQL